MPLLHVVARMDWRSARSVVLDAAIPSFEHHRRECLRSCACDDSSRGGGWRRRARAEAKAREQGACGARGEEEVTRSAAVARRRRGERRGGAQPRDAHTRTDSAEQVDEKRSRRRLGTRGDPRRSNNARIRRAHTTANVFKCNQHTCRRIVSVYHSAVLTPRCVCIVISLSIRDATVVCGSLISCAVLRFVVCLSAVLPVCLTVPLLSSPPSSPPLIMRVLLVLALVAAACT